MMRSTLSKVVLLAIILCYTSCSTYKQIPYFQDLDHTKVSEENINNYSPLKIHSGDLLGISVASLSTENQFKNTNSRVTGADYLGTNSTRSNIGQGADNSNPNPVYGYRVNQQGEITIPYLGKITVSGITTDELAAKLTAELEQYLKQPVVNIRILNFKVSVLGDVVRPDVFSIQNERITIMEALGLAGDLTITAKRKNVLLIREIDGKRQFLPIDLTSKNLFSSPYYYLQNNDVIYVEPDRIKYAPFDRGYRGLMATVAFISGVGVIITTYFLYHNSSK